MSEDNRTGRKIALGAAVAATVGYLAGILTAPKSGKETRQDIVDTATQGKAETVAKLNELHDELDALVESTKDKGGDLSARAKEELKKAVETAKDAQAKSTTVLKAVKKGEADNPELNKAIKQATQAKTNLVKYLKS